MTDKEQPVVQTVAALYVALASVCELLVENDIITKDALIEKLDATGLGVSRSRNAGVGNATIERLIRRIRAVGTSQ